MRTTINIDDDVLMAAKSIARDRAAPLGTVISGLLRKALQVRTTFNAGSELPVFRVREGAMPIISEQIRRAEDEGEW